MGSKRIEHKEKNGCEVKYCSKCNLWKHLSEFRKDSSKWDGLYSSCKECSSTKDKQWYKENSEKKYQSVLSYQRRTGLINKYKPYNPKYYSSGKSKLKKRARDIRRRVLKKKADGINKITDKDILLIREKYNFSCAYCGKDCKTEYHIDHKIPLSRGGDNSPQNLALSCPLCNWSKHDKTDVEFVGYHV